jgi:4-amino-4-deoxychorismate lyase
MIFSLVNGNPGTDISLHSRGLHYGDGLFETFLLIDGTPVLEDLHIKRLREDSTRLQLALDWDALDAEWQQFLAADDVLGQTGVAKIIACRAAGQRGYGFEPNQPVDRILVFYPGCAYPAERRQGVRVGISDKNLPYDDFAGIKHLNRLTQVHASARGSLDEVLLCGQKGEVIEATFSNLFAVKNNCLLTPLLNRAGVSGVMRRFILEVLADTLGLDTKETRMSVADLVSADELFLCNSVFGIWPVKALGVRQYEVGEVTRRLMDEIDNLGYSNLYV